MYGSQAPYHVNAQLNLVERITLSSYYFSEVFVYIFILQMDVAMEITHWTYFCFKILVFMKYILLTCWSPRAAAASANLDTCLMMGDILVGPYSLTDCRACWYASTTPWIPKQYGLVGLPFRANSWDTYIVIIIIFDPSSSGGLL